MKIDKRKALRAIANCEQPIVSNAREVRSLQLERGVKVILAARGKAVLDFRIYAKLPHRYACALWFDTGVGELDRVYFVKPTTDLLDALRVKLPEDLFEALNLRDTTDLNEMVEIFGELGQALAGRRKTHVVQFHQ